MSDRNIRISAADHLAVEDQEVEIVERKGLGHPDSICDGIAEAVSRSLSQLYQERVGEVLHYNTDETQLVAGSANPDFGGGEILEPIYVLIVGRATSTYEKDGEKLDLPVESTAVAAACEYIEETVPALDVGTDVIVDVKLGEGSGDLQGVFDEGDERSKIPMANDTSFGVGHAPLTETEQIVLNAERALNGYYADDHPEIGADVKIMGKREGDTIDITVAAAMIDGHIADMDDYRQAVDDVEAFVTGLASDYTDREVSVEVNTADSYDGVDGIYLTTTGTSAEQGDDGSVGRGNRANGLITPNRPMSMEATSGKNPVNHIGKIYNLLSTNIAETVVDEVEGIRDLRIRLLSQIGRPIDRPHVADAEVVTDSGVSVADIEQEVRDIIDAELADVTTVTQGAIDGDLTTF